MFYHDLIERGETALFDAVRNKMQEGLLLDFKSDSQENSQIFTKGALTKIGKRVLGKALSAFSNSAGGLIVFGVRCRESDGIDAAEELEPLSEWEKAYSAVSSAVGDLLQPKNDGIEVRGFPSDMHPGHGYVVVQVPRSERRPHRCEAGGQKSYYKRSGSSSFEMEHYDIEDAFRRAGSPDLTLLHELNSGAVSSNQSGLTLNIDVVLAVSNQGLATAKFVSLKVVEQTGISLKIGASYQPPKCATTRFGGHVSLMGNAQFAVNPGETKVFETFSFSVHLSGSGEWTVGGSSLVGAHHRLKYALTAENMRVKEGELLIPSESIYKILRAQGY